MFPVKKIAGSLAILGIIGISTACVTGGSAQASGSNHGHVKYQVTIEGGFQFLASGGSTVTTTPQYSFDVQGYPYNRLVLTANSVSTNPDGSTTTTPMQLAIGSQFPVTVVVGGFTKIYLTTIETSSDLSFGMYILNAPGIVQDVNAALQESPGSSMQVSIPGSSAASVLPINSMLMPIAQREIGDSNITINISSSDLAPWGSLQIDSTVLPPHPGPVTKQQ